MQLVLLHRSWSTLYVAFSKDTVSWVFYFDLPLLIQCACVKVNFSWNSTCSAKEVIILFRLWSTLYIAFSKYILIVLFWFITFYPKCIYKRDLFSKVWVLQEKCSDIASFVEHLLCSFFKMDCVLVLVFWFLLVTIHLKFIYKSHLFLKFQGFRKGSSFIASFAEHPVCSNFKMYCVLILIFLF